MCLYVKLKTGDNKLRSRYITDLKCMNINKLLLCILLLTPIQVLAGPGTGSVKLTDLKVESGHVYLYLASAVSNPLSCGLSSPIKLESTDAGFTEMYSAALTALTTSKSISFWLRSCVSSPWGKTVPKAYALSLSAK